MTLRILLILLNTFSTSVTSVATVIFHLICKRWLAKSAPDGQILVLTLAAFGVAFEVLSRSLT